MATSFSAARSARTHQSTTSGARPLHVERLEDRRLLAGRAADAINAFAFDVYDQMQRESGNLLFSPLSVANTLAVTFAGAAGQTAAEIQRVLHAGPEPGFHESFGTLLATLRAQTAGTTPSLAVKNAVWPQTDMPLVPDFVSTAYWTYSSHIQDVDYRGDTNAAQNVINTWVNQQTNGRINNLVEDLTSDTRLVLTNTVLFSGLWSNPFPVNKTQNGVFTRADGSQLNSVPLMYTETVLNSTPSSVAATTIAGFKVVELPFAAGNFGANISMTLVLPPAQGDQFLSESLFSQVESWLDGPQPFVSAVIKVPRFKTTVDTDLNPLLVSLGMPSAFTPGLADFSAMTPEEIFLQETYQKASLEVNERGTIAAAATAFEFGICFAKGTPVSTPNGFVAIEELKVGDQVLARHDENHRGEVQGKAIERVSCNESEIFELRICDRTIRTTATHPFYVQGKGWQEASKLKPGDMLATNTNEWVEVEASRSTSAIEKVYNLQVADFHTYFVASTDRRLVVWVHNACFTTQEFYFNRPFDVIIRDNTSSTILFMGRINDPTQSQNSVVPTFVPEPNAAVVAAVGVIIAGAHERRRRKSRLAADMNDDDSLVARALDLAFEDDSHIGMT